MKTPTLEEVKQYFKDADRCISVYGSEFNFKSLVKFYKGNSGSAFAEDKSGFCFCLYSKTLNKYAQILN